MTASHRIEPILGASEGQLYASVEKRVSKPGAKRLICITSG